jgi:hypothetical protein
VPRGLDVVKEGAADSIYFSGLDPASGTPGLFKVGAGGGAVSTIASGAPLIDPSGVAVAGAGVVYVSNAASLQASHGSILKVSGGQVSELVSDVMVGFPAGVAVTRDGRTLVVSARDATSGGDLVLLVDTGTKAVTPFTGLGDSTGAGGLHRAPGADIFSWSDTSAGGTGIVYRVVLK